MNKYLAQFLSHNNLINIADTASQKNTVPEQAFGSLANEFCVTIRIVNWQKWHIGQFRRNVGRRQWHPTPVLLPGTSHGRRSLVGCSPWGRQESDTTEQLPFHFSLSRIGEGNGNPLQCSCLENPRDGGAWWAAVYGARLSRTRLK